MINKKSSLISEYSNLLFFWFVGVVYFFLFRLFFWFLYRSDISDNAQLIDYLKGIYMGFRFDVTVVFYFLAVPLLFTYIFIPLKKINFVKKTRQVFQWIFAIFSVVISVITLNYYKEYQNQFDHFLFLGLYDDQKAVAQSIFKEFNPFLNISVCITLIFILVKIFQFYENKTKIERFLDAIQLKYKNFIFSFFMLIFIIVSARGSFSEYPVRKFYSSITADEFINKTIVNPFRALSYAIEDYQELNDENGVNPYGDLPKSIEKQKTITGLLHKKTSAIATENPPEQIFLVVMESYDRYCLMGDYAELGGVNTKLKNIQNNGVHFPYFLPSSSTTMNSFSSIITTIPYTGVNTSIIGATNAYPSSIFNIFKKLGYETNFFYAGYLSWQNIKNFTRKQGAEHIFGAGNIEGKKGIWGVNDEDLFKKVLKTVDTDKKSINIILTLSYHQPYEIDVVSKGFPYKTINDLPENLKKVYDEKELPLKTFGHLWYADKMLGNFVKKAEKKYKNALFAFTGDHWGRKKLDHSPNLYKTSAVPFILYGEPVAHIKGAKNNAGSHIDITPTLLTLVAPQNYEYLSFGNSLLNTDNQNIGIGFQKVITPEFIQEFSGNATKQEPLDSNNKSEVKSDLKKKHDSLLYLGWHYIKKGDRLINNH